MQQIGHRISQTIKTGIFFILVLCSIQGFAQSGSSMLEVELIHQSFGWGIFPIQEGQVNSNFTFNFARYINVQYPEIAYRVTNTHSTVLNNLELKTILPSGLTRSDYIFDDCSRHFMLYPNRSCLIRFKVDMNAYVPTNGMDPMICSENDDCAWPVEEHQLNSAVANAENTQLKVTPAEQDGLSYDPNTFSITGTPSRTGYFVFEVVAYNKHTASAPLYLRIQIYTDPKDKPVFKKDLVIPSATPNEDYQLNLMDLVEQNPSFMKSNQIQFIISTNHHFPAWLSIDETKSVLQGHVPPEAAGQEASLWLIARSNTGGDTYYELIIPVVSDPNQKPVIKEGIEFKGEVAGWFEKDLQRSITDATNSSDLELIIDSVKPEAPWLKAYKTTISGMIPGDNETLGITYQVRLHAHTKIGGDSSVVTVPITIGINKNLTPYFRHDRSFCPDFYEGQSYLCDFVANKAIFPNDIPYTVEFAPGFPIPQWLRLEDNTLIADRVSAKERFTRIYLVIKNIPGGASKVLEYFIFVENDRFKIIPATEHL